MYSMTVWKNAKKPNYETNIFKEFPYSDVPYLRDCDLVKIPVSMNNLIQHVDYWGEGRVVSGDGVSGFPNCYNINHQYHLVSSGPDKDKKIPNRIPVLSYTDCDTSAYIKDNSVITVTVSGPNINASCAQDIARIVNNDLGKVVVFGVESDSQEVVLLADELKKKGLLPESEPTELPTELQGLTLYKNYVTFRDAHTFKDELKSSITNAHYYRALYLSKSMEATNAGKVIEEVVKDLISTCPRNVMSYGYKLWQGGAESIVRTRFPIPFAFIFDEQEVLIINQKYKLALKMDANTDSMNDRLVWGDSSDKLSKRVHWKLIPAWKGNTVVFKLYNIDCDMYVKLDAGVDDIGDRKAWGSSNSNELRHKYYLEPVLENDVLVFYVINCQYNQGLKMAVAKDSMGDRLVWGHNGDLQGTDNRYRWIITMKLIMY